MSDTVVVYPEEEVGWNLPKCPYCKERMTRAYEENEEGDWSVRWLCDCEIPDEILAEIERMS